MLFFALLFNEAAYKCHMLAPQAAGLGAGLAEDEGLGGPHSSPSPQLDKPDKQVLLDHPLLSVEIGQPVPGRQGHRSSLSVAPKDATEASGQLVGHTVSRSV